MMKARKIIPLLALTALMSVLALPTHGQSGIICNRCDTVRQEVVSADVPPIGTVGPRIVLQYANAVRRAAVVAPPPALQTVFGQVGDRIALQYANAVLQAAMVAPPGELQALFGQVANRVILQYANTSRRMALAYPKSLIGDTSPPQISNVQTQNVAGGIKVTWTTDEFSTSEVRWGTSHGTYPWVVGSPLYEKQHEVTLGALIPGTTYYFVVVSIDRSGNQAVSGEYQVKARWGTYLPLVTR